MPKGLRLLSEEQVEALLLPTGFSGFARGDGRARHRRFVWLTARRG